MPWGKGLPLLGICKLLDQPVLSPGSFILRALVLPAHSLFSLGFHNPGNNFAEAERIFTRLIHNMLIATK